MPFQNIPTFRSFEQQRGEHYYPRNFSSKFRFSNYKSEDRVLPRVVVSLDGKGDFDNIQSAIDNLPSGGGEVFIRPGTYVLASGISISSDNVTITGSGPSTVLQTSDNIPLISINGNFATVQNLKIIGANNNSYAANQGVLLSNSTSTSQVLSCNISDCFSGISLQDCSKCLIRYNQTTSNCSGIRGNLAVQCDISNNQSYNNVRHGIQLVSTLTPNLISSNLTTNNNLNGIYLYGSSKTTIIDNTILSNNSNNESWQGGISIAQDSNQNNILSNGVLNNKTYEVIINDSNCNSNLINGNNLAGTDHIASISDSGTDTQIAHNTTS